MVAMSDPGQGCPGAQPIKKQGGGGGPGTRPARTRPVIRNFCIIAHIDHGKSTLADRMLCSDRHRGGAGRDARPVPGPDGHRARARHHDQEPGGPAALEEEDGTHYVLNMIDTPATSTSPTRLFAQPRRPARGAVLLVDAAQGIEAQTLANLYWPSPPTSRFIPVLQQDRPPGRPARALRGRAGRHHRHRPERGPQGLREGREKASRDLLNVIVDQVPHPAGDPNAPARALIFDSVYDTYRGAWSPTSGVVDGKLSKRERDA